MMNILRNIFDHEYKELNKFSKYADKIEELSDKYSKLSDKKIKEKTLELKERYKKGEILEDLLPEAFANAREASFRAIGEKPFYCQLLGAIAIHFGNIAEMKTGEGKTLTTVMPAYLNAITGNGVHVITVNEYLTSRNAEWMGKIFDMLDVSVGVNLRELSPSEKKEAYDKDILYTTNNELGFDYLRDNMIVESKNRVQRGLNYAILDEVDSMLIDEARTPLIISGGAMKSMNLYVSTDMFVKTLIKEKDYTIEEKTNSIVLTDEGNEKASKYFKIDNIYDIENSGLIHHINQALRANYMMQRDVDYVVDNNEIVIVDQFTGRLMKGRAYSEGLHQAIEAKEGVKVQDETKTLATITFQNLFRMYKKLSGMTGTAKTEEEEFRNIYNMYVIQIPTNKPIIREDLADLLYSTKQAKFNAIVNEVERRHKEGQPILVGTIAIETSELVSTLLNRRSIKHEVLNAKNHGREAEIIAKAGEKGSVTIATNMAGRGTDIKLGKGVVDLGGLCVIGTERHEARRIDNQLRGRSGRQGDPGVTQFFISLEDDIMLKFGTDRLKTTLQTMGLDGDAAIRSKMFSRAVESAQKRVEGNNFDTRKQLLQYDNVMNEHREIIYTMRNEIIDSESIRDKVIDIFNTFVNSTVENYINTAENYKPEDNEEKIDNYQELTNHLNKNILRNNIIKTSDIKNKDIEKVKEIILEKFTKFYENKVKEMPIEITNEFEKAIALRVVDSRWMDHINDMEHLKEGIGLRGYANENPLQAYIKEGYETFDVMIDKINKETCLYLLSAEIRRNVEREQVAKPIADNSGEAKSAPIKKKEKIGRNDPCPCGSGKKYKNCCGK
ncbi:MAG: preprotein translocase subunit SecA [Bacilli bacterium]|nr:preprotein translocase subunit SecA [Bacilli bacterium]